MNEEPKSPYWFRTIEEAVKEFNAEPEDIEYLNINDGSVIRHTLGTAYWNNEFNMLDGYSLRKAGWTHCRIKW